MRIVMICSSPGIGLVPYPVELAIYFREHGHEVYAIAGAEKEYEIGLHARLSKANIPLHYVPCIDSSYGWLNPTRNMLRSLLSKLDPDVVHYWGPRNAFQGYLWWQRKQPIRIAMIGSMGHVKGISPGVRIAASIANRSLDRVLGLCEIEVDRLLKVGIDPKKVGIMHFPLACSRNLEYARDGYRLGKAEVLKKHRVPNGKKLLAMFAHFHPHKGHELLLSSFTKLAPDFPDWDLVLGGDGVTVERCRTMANKLTNRVHFVGRLPHDEVMRLLSLCDAAVHPSFVETYGFSMLEPLLFGLPSVITHVGIAQELERASVAIVVEPKDELAFSQGLRRLLRNDEDIRAMGARGREYVLKTFDTPVISEQLLSLYSSMM